MRCPDFDLGLLLHSMENGNVLLDAAIIETHIPGVYETDPDLQALNDTIRQYGDRLARKLSVHVRLDCFRCPARYKLYVRARAVTDFTTPEMELSGESPDEEKVAARELEVDQMLLGILPYLYLPR